MAQFFTSVDAIALVAATAKSIWEIATPSTSRCRIKEVSLMFDGVTASAVPVKIEIGRFSAAVTTATTLTPAKQDPGSPASLCVVKHSTSTEGAGTVSDAYIWRISPTSGVIYQIPLGDEFIIAISAFGRIRCTAAANVNVTIAGIRWEET